MWPIVQNGDYCLFHPVQAVNREKAASSVGVEKHRSTISVGDIVFCLAQPKKHFYAHFVRQIVPDALDEDGTPQPQYWIGGLPTATKDRPWNGHAFRRRIFGILKAAFVKGDGAFLQRPHPLDTGRENQTLYERVKNLLMQDARHPEAMQLCRAFPSPEMHPPEEEASAMKKSRQGRR